MQKLFFTLLLSIFLFSCSKEKHPTIVGEWKEIASYHSDASGVLQWHYMPDFGKSYRLKLVSDGTWSAGSDYVMGQGTYQYSAQQLTCKDIGAGTVSITPVSYLDEHYLVIDILSNGVLVSKRKFEKN